LIVTVVCDIDLLSCAEAYAYNPVKAHACKLEFFCKRGKGNNMVQCLELDKNSMRPARLEIIRLEILVCCGRSTTEWALLL
jgi:hypothetical protein